MIARRGMLALAALSMPAVLASLAQGVESRKLARAPGRCEAPAYKSPVRRSGDRDALRSCVLADLVFGNRQFYGRPNRGGSIADWPDADWPDKAHVRIANGGRIGAVSASPQAHLWLGSPAIPAEWGPSERVRP